RVMGHGAADGVLLEEGVAEAGGAAADRRGDPGRSGPHDHHVHALAPVGAAAFLYRAAEARGDLQPLDERVLDEAHARQLAHDVNARPAGLEELVDLRQLDAALGRAEDQLDGVDGALRGALTVAYALRRVEQGGHAVDEAE